MDYVKENNFDYAAVGREACGCRCVLLACFTRWRCLLLSIA
jgi:hypothetical protein